MISQKMQDALNKQIQAELFSAYLYLSMSAYCESANLKGFAHWLKIQYEEETNHGLKLVDFLQERGGSVNLFPIEAPPLEFGSPTDLFAKVKEHEQYVTSLIHGLYETALSEKDYASQIFLQWYITEQVEEEATAISILEKLKMLPEKAVDCFSWTRSWVNGAVNHLAN